jgi:hypothetical protein
VRLPIVLPKMPTALRLELQSLICCPLYRGVPSHRHGHDPDWLIGASPGGRHTRGTVQSKELQAPMMRPAGARSMRGVAGRGWPPGTYPPDGR